MKITWMELPVKDIERALKFYRAVFKLGEIEIAADGTRKTATLSSTGDDGSPGVSLTEVAGFEPAGKSGIWVYFDAGGDFEGHVARVTEAGGTVVEPYVSMGQAGGYASFLDTEGNLVAIYAYPQS